VVAKSGDIKEPFEAINSTSPQDRITNVNSALCRPGRIIYLLDSYWADAVPTEVSGQGAQASSFNINFGMAMRNIDQGRELIYNRLVLDI
jgi:hypothetical protein